ncbi:MAG: tetratricopeptide repeat protein, partial [Patescibacteria group bacterium]
LLLPPQAALIGLLCGYAFNNMFVFDNLGSAIFFFALLSYAHSLSRKELPSSVAFTKPLSDHAVAIAAPIAAVAVLAAGWALNGPGLLRAQILTSVIGTAPSSAMPKFKQALEGPAWPGTELGFQETTEQLIQYVPSVVADSSSDPAFKEDAVRTAVVAGERLLAQRPTDSRIELFMANLMGQIGRENEALAYADSAVSHSPRKQQLLFQLASLQFQTGKSGAAIETFRRAFELAPDYAIARVLYAGAHYYTGAMAEGDRILREGFGDVIYNNDQLIRIYMDTQQYDRAAAIWQLRIDQSPQDIELRARIAEIYLRAGQKEKAIAALREVSKLKPALAGQIEQLIQQIESGKLTL